MTGTSFTSLSLVNSLTGYEPKLGVEIIEKNKEEAYPFATSYHGGKGKERKEGSTSCRAREAWLRHSKGFEGCRATSTTTAGCRFCEVGCRIC